MFGITWGTTTAFPPKPEPIMATPVATGVTFKDINEFHEKVTHLQGWMAHLSHIIAIALTMDEQMQEKDAIANSLLDWPPVQARKMGIRIYIWIKFFSYPLPSWFQTRRVFLNILDMLSPSFSTDFLLRFHVPVWFRWGPDQIEAVRVNPWTARLAPLAVNTRKITSEKTTVRQLVWGTLPNSNG